MYRFKSCLAKGVLLSIASLSLLSCGDAGKLAKSEPVFVNVCDGMSVCLGVFPGDVADYADEIAAAGFKWVRHRLLWSDIEKSPGEYVWDGSQGGPNHDSIVEEFNRRGIGVLLMSALWSNNDVYPELEGKTPFNEAGRQNFANYMQAAAAHFKGKKVLYELGNEPNIKAFWPTDQNGDGTVEMDETREAAKQYAALAKTVVPAIRSPKGDPGAFIVSAGLANRGGPYIDNEIGARAYMKQLRDEEALTPLFDRVGLHLYTAEGKNPKETQAAETAAEEQYIDLYRELIGDSGIEIYDTEHGWKSDGSDLQERLKASYNVRSHLYGVSKGVLFRAWFVWNGSPGNTAYFIRGTHSARAAQVLNQELGDYRFVRRLKTQHPDQYVYEYLDDGNSRKLVAWVRDANTPTQFLYPSEGDVEIVSVLGERSSLASEKSQLELRLSVHPVYVIFED